MLVFLFLQSGQSWTAAFILAQSESCRALLWRSCCFSTSYLCYFRISWLSEKAVPYHLTPESFTQRKHWINNHGRQTQKAEPKGISPSAPSSPHQPPQTLRPACQQKCYLLSGPATASLPKEQRQIQKVHRSTRATQRGVHHCCSSTKDHQVCVITEINYWHWYWLIICM